MEAFYLLSSAPPAPNTPGFNIFSETWSDGTPFTRGGNGYNPGNGTDTTRFIFDGAPVDGVPWTLCTQDTTLPDVRSIYYIGPQTLLPGDRASFTLAITTVFDVPYSGGCPDIEMVCAQSDEVREFYTDQRRAADLMTSSYEPYRIDVMVFPNPASSRVSVRLPEGITPVLFKLYNTTGWEVLSIQPAAREFSFRSSDDQLPAGQYFYRLQTEASVVITGKLVLR